MHILTDMRVYKRCSHTLLSVIHSKDKKQQLQTEIQEILFFSPIAIELLRKALLFPSLMILKTQLDEGLSNLLYLKPLSAEQLDKISYINSL